MKVDKELLDQIMIAIEEYLEYDVEGSHHAGFDITPFIPKKDVQRVIDSLNMIFEK